jgi:hypothetical protein
MFIGLKPVPALKLSLYFYCFLFAFISKTPKVEAAQRAIVSKRPAAVVYQSPSLDAKKLGRLRRGTKIVISDGTRNGFHKMKLKNGFGWIQNKDVFTRKKARERKARRESRQRGGPEEGRAQEEQDQMAEDSRAEDAARSVDAQSGLNFELAYNLLSSSGLEDSLGADSVGSYFSLIGDYAYGYSQNMQFHGGIEIPFQDYSTAVSGGAINGTLSGFAPYFGVSYLLWPEAIEERKAFSLSLSGGLRLAYQMYSLDIENTANGSSFTGDMTGIAFYPYLRGGFRLNSLLSFYGMVAYRLSQVSEIEFENSTSDVDLSGISIMGGLSINF